MGHHEGANVKFVAGEALEPYRRVKEGSTVGEVVYADANDAHIGWTKDRAASGAVVNVCMAGQTGTIELEAAGAITAGNMCYGAADGEVAATGDNPVGTARETGADGKVIEIIPTAAFGGGVFRIEHTVTAGEDTAGQVDIDTGFGAAPSVYVWDVRTSAGAGQKLDQVVTNPSGGTIRIADGSTNDVGAGDIITLVAWR